MVLARLRGNGFNSPDFLRLMSVEVSLKYVKASEGRFVAFLASF